MSSFEMHGNITPTCTYRIIISGGDVPDAILDMIVAFGVAMRDAQEDVRLRRHGRGNPIPGGCDMRYLERTDHA